jgi:hypothetical protein
MRFLVLLHFLLCLGVGGLQSQKLSKVYRVLLEGGSVVYSSEILFPDSMHTELLLNDESKLLIPNSQILRKGKKTYHPTVLADTRLLKERGYYCTVALQTMVAERSANNNESLRWGFGGHVSAGYRWSNLLGAGLGIGLDANDYVLSPVFAEFQSFLLFAGSRAKNKIFRSKWRRVIPLFCNVQLGYNLPLYELLKSEEEVERLEGGLLVYPTIGFMLPSKGGNTFRVDFGYKFQKFKRIWEVEWRPGYAVIDYISLRSFSMRVSWMF